MAASKKTSTANDYVRVCPHCGSTETSFGWADAWQVDQCKKCDLGGKNWPMFPYTPATAGTVLGRFPEIHRKDVKKFQKIIRAQQTEEKNK